MAATAVTLNDLQGHSQVACLFKCNPSNIYAAFYTNSTDSVLVVLLSINQSIEIFSVAQIESITETTKLLQRLR